MTFGHHPGGPTARQLSRRAFLAVAAGSLAACTVSDSPVSAAVDDELHRTWRVPAEDVRHRRMDGLAVELGDLGELAAQESREDIALIARTIAHYEPVVMLARDRAAARKARRWCGPHVKVIDTIPVDDCWMRDSGPIFRQVRNGSLGLSGSGSTVGAASRSTSTTSWWLGAWPATLRLDSKSPTSSVRVAASSATVTAR